MKNTKLFAVFVALLLTVVVIPGMVSARSPTVKDIQAGDTVFVYEQNLNVAALMPDGYPPQKFVKFSNDNPDKTVSGGGVQVAEIPVNTDGTLSIYSAPAYMGIWYPYNATAPTSTHTGDPISIQHADISLDAVLSNSHVDSIAGKSITRDSPISFKLTSNYVSSYYSAGGVRYGQVDIEVTTPGGGKIRVFGSNNADLRNINLTKSLMYTDTDGIHAVPISLTTLEAGTYTAQAVWDTSMPWYHQESDSNPVSFTVSSKALTITSNPETVVSGTDFTVTITGEANHVYYVYLKGTSSSGYPTLIGGQVGVDVSPVLLSAVSDEAGAAGTYANVTTDVSGARTVEFSTDSVTDNTDFTIKVVDPSDSSKYDTVTIEVTKGAVSLTMGGTGVFYMGQVIQLQGTSSKGDSVYLFMTGPNLNSNGVRIDQPSISTIDGHADTFKTVSVDADHTWKYKWDTSQLGIILDPGTYTIYAVDNPSGKDDLSNHAYQTASVTIRQGYISINSVPNTIASGDKLVISGIASGNPSNVYVWIFGKNYRNIYNSVSVQDDSTYKYTMDDTTGLYSGQYFVIVQHPMANGPGVVGAFTNGNPGCSGTSCYGITGNVSSSTYNLGVIGLSGLQAPDAAQALTNALDSPNIDDLYAKTSFQIQNPVININAISDKRIGDQVTVTGTTNLATGDNLQINVVSASFQPTTKQQTSEFSAAAGTVPVMATNATGGYNTFSFTFDTSTFKADEYLVTAESIETSASSTITLNVLEKSAVKPTPISTPVVVTTIPTTIPTPIQTVVTTVPTTAAPTPTPTKKSPGFEGIVAIAGLAAVALLMVWRRQH